MTSKSIIIIGGGIAGLSAGCYAQVNGYLSNIYEMHDLPGGLCTAWERKGYKFDGCIDWFTGTQEDGMFYSIWQELGVIQNNTFLYDDEYWRYVTKQGKTIIFYTDVVRLELELKSAYPQDAHTIEELCGVIRALQTFRPPVGKAMETMGPLDYMKMMAGMLKNLKAYMTFFRYGKKSMADFAACFKSKTLRDMFTTLWGEHIPFSMFASTMAWCANKTAGFPQGGSLKIARDMEKKYLSLGGKMHYKQKVEKILVQEGKAIGVRLEDGTEQYADIVISASDGYATLYNMLEGRYITESIRDWYDNMPTFPPYIQVSLGVKRDMRGDARTYCIQLDEPLQAAEQDIDTLIVHNYSFDRTQAPEGKASMAIRFFTDYAYWERLYKNKKNYKTAKNALGKAVILKLEKHFPGISKQVEAIDVATPMTYVRYTGTWKGATMAWLPTTQNFGKSLPKTIPALGGFYMCGQWLVPGGGIPNALKTARDTIQIICRKDGKKFKTTVQEG